jgi:hypothetical protein
MNTSEENIIINNIPLSPEEINQFEKFYGQRLRSGQYWYDKLSGMFGILGQPALGYLKPGHEYGTLQRNASNGNTKVLINNRELTQMEYMMLCQLVGTIVLPGSYWLDAQGNAGIQGNPYPMVNLVMAAQQHAQRGTSGGDNFWSSRYAAGNSTSDGSAGYINLGDGTSATWGM